MAAEIIDWNLHLAGGPHSVLKRTLMTDLEKLPVQVAKHLLNEALQYSVRRFNDFEFIDRVWFRLLFSLNQRDTDKGRRQ